MSFKKGLIALAALAGAGWSAGAFAAQPEPWQTGFQPAASAVMEAVRDFYDLLFVIIVAIAAFVLALLVYVMVRFNAKRNPVPSKTSHNTFLEMAWTAIPVVILVVIAIPSFRLLYFQKTVSEAEMEMTVKVIGYQWYWSYEYPDHGDIAFDSFIVEEEDLEPGQLRLLEVDNRVVLPVDTNIRLLVTAEDVLHSWAVPAFGIKIDAVPGRLNETWVRIEREGVYYGQCSELCGVRHGYMPVAVEAVSKDAFASWVERAKVEFARAGGPDTAVGLARVDRVD
ncbi:MAG: cytochrome c oxidase subunit II [Proteobacteria bacterium]|nr:cytochrome c oxidase subunit II [Pseudomonadota bacterium]